MSGQQPPGYKIHPEPGNEECFICHVEISSDDLEFHIMDHVDHPDDKLAQWIVEIYRKVEDLYKKK